MTTQQPGFSMSQYASSKDLVAAMIARITALESQLAQRFDAADMATAAQAVVPPNAIAASIMRHDGGEAPVFRLMAAYRSEKDAMDAFTLITAAPAQPAAQQPHGAAYAAQQASTVTNYSTLGAAMRAIRQSIQMIGDPEDECMRAVKRVLRGAVIIVEDSGDEVAAPAAPAQPAAQQGAADGFFLLLPQRPKPEAPAGTVGLDWDAYSGAQMLAFGRDSSDAAIAALRTEQPAPSGATEEVENLRKALVYAAFALHATPQYMLAQGITLIDGDTVRVSRDGWTVEASINPHRQPAPATQQAVDAARKQGEKQ